VNLELQYKVRAEALRDALYQLGSAGVLRFLRDHPAEARALRTLLQQAKQPERVKKVRR